MQVAVMDKLYCFVIKCQDQFQQPDRIAELKTAAWNANTHTTEMHKWIRRPILVPAQCKCRPPSTETTVPDRLVSDVTKSLKPMAEV